MEHNTFFESTPLHKKFKILNFIEKNKIVTQRLIAEHIGVAVSLINGYLNELEMQKLIIRQYKSSKSIDYTISNKGIEFRKLLNIWYLRESQSVYSYAKDNITIFINKMIERGFERILLYGAGEVAEILLNVIIFDNSLPIEVLAIIDDDYNKHEKYIMNVKVISPENLKKYKFDAILISSYTHHNLIYKKLIDMNIQSNKIAHFFE